MEYINYHYNRIRKKKNVSGQHETIDGVLEEIELKEFAEGKGWIIFYHDKLEEIGDTDLSNAAYAVLPDNVFNTSDKRMSPRCSPVGELSILKKQKNDARQAATNAIKDKNHEIYLFTKNEHQISKEKRLNELEDDLVDLLEGYEMLVSTGSRLKRKLRSDNAKPRKMKAKLDKIKRRKKVCKRKIARAEGSINKLKEELGIVDEEKDSESSGSDANLSISESSCSGEESELD